MTKSNKTLPFNNRVETGLRVLTILDEIHPNHVDLTKLLYLDYLTVHSGDVNQDKNSLHLSLPYRRGELLVRKPIIEYGLKLLISRGLVRIKYLSTGIHYESSEYSTPFMDSLSTPYVQLLIDRAKWVAETYNQYSTIELHDILDKNKNSRISEFNLEILD